MSRDAALYLDDIKNSCAKVIRYTETINFEQFCKDEKTYDAVVRNLEIMGEAAKHLPDSICKQLSNIEWSKIKGLRDIIVHEYFGLDMDIIWDIVQNKIPHLLAAVEQFSDKRQFLNN